jgi:mono/diheme cytochrome c family protein
MRRSTIVTALFTLGLPLLPGVIEWRLLSASPDQAAPAASAAARVERGAYLVRTVGCNDCHTPFKLGPAGPEPDMTRALSGHPADIVMPPPPKLPEGPWGWTGAVTNTAFAGPWGVSFTANLTPDPDTGLGKWTEEMFLAALRTGRHEGKGRPILPPMPYKFYGTMNDDDLKAIFAYLQSLKPIRNRVPNPVDPPEGTR